MTPEEARYGVVALGLLVGAIWFIVGCVDVLRRNRHELRIRGDINIAFEQRDELLRQGRRLEAQKHHNRIKELYDELRKI